MEAPHRHPQFAAALGGFEIGSGVQLAPSRGGFGQKRVHQRNIPGRDVSQ